jgi:hypothetical protein
MIGQFMLWACQHHSCNDSFHDSLHASPVRRPSTSSLKKFSSLISIQRVSVLRCSLKSNKMNQAHILIMNHHKTSVFSLVRGGRACVAFSRGACGTLSSGGALSVGGHIHAAACEAGLLGLTSPAWPVGAPGSRRHAGSAWRCGRAVRATPRRAAPCPGRLLRIRQCGRAHDRLCLAAICTNRANRGRARPGSRHWHG